MFAAVKAINVGRMPCPAAVPMSGGRMFSDGFICRNFISSQKTTSGGGMASDPEKFRLHLRDVLKQVKNDPQERRIVFVKSWNEWAEGNYLEPDQEHGRGYLEVLKQELEPQISIPQCP
jgi:hypothetical protein